MDASKIEDKGNFEREVKALSSGEFSRSDLVSEGRRGGGCSINGSAERGKETTETGGDEGLLVSGSGERGCVMVASRSASGIATGDSRARDWIKGEGDTPGSSIPASGTGGQGTIATGCDTGSSVVVSSMIRSLFRDGDSPRTIDDTGGSTISSKATDEEGTGKGDIAGCSSVGAWLIVSKSISEEIVVI